ncbi:hypothetical protein HPB48_020875 [Haemaphysalis longicornis]|uniref:VWFA domain-containing protein n=1 Tax=Haemaphysalis longicornis TaxID=44386 RepID=A0A9J6FNL3_HAELO|nr:hypothetical protein HPB48_020875 [Haemaphysalis longicornis]
MSKKIQVTFEEEQQKEDLAQRVVLVLDVSGSMKSHDRLKFLKEAATRYIKDIQDSSQRLAIVTFSTKATVLHPLMPVNINTRRGFLDKIAGLRTDASTCIGCGLEKALELLNTPSEVPEGAIIILMSDGEENVRPDIKAVKPKVEKAKVTVNTVALGATADHKLEELAIATKAKAYAYQDLQGNLALELETAFIEATTAQVGTWKLHLETDSPDEIDVSVQVKSQARKDGGEPIRVTCEVGSILVGQPNEAIVYAKVTKGKQVVLNAVVHAEVTGPKVRGQPHKSTFLLLDDGRVPDNHADDGTYSGYFTKFIGKGRYAVSAHVSNQNGTRLADPLGGSGSFFSTPMLTLTTGCSFPNLTHASNTFLVASLDAASEYPIDDFIVVNTTTEDTNSTTPGVSQPVDDFQRVASGGSFQVTEDIVENQVPPGEIRDLTVVDVQPGSNGTLLVQLSWTWPGAHLTAGKASAVRIRASEDYPRLKSSFDNQTEITNANVVVGNLDPLPSGARHVVTVALPAIFATPRSDGESNWSAYLAARVINSDGLSSYTSNIAVASYTPPPITTTVATTTTTPATTTATPATTATGASATDAPNTGGFVTGKKDSQSSGVVPSLWAWILIAVAAAVVIALIVIIVSMKNSPNKRGIYHIFANRAQRHQTTTA